MHSAIFMESCAQESKPEVDAGGKSKGKCKGKCKGKNKHGKGTPPPESDSQPTGETVGSESAPQCCLHAVSVL